MKAATGTTHLINQLSERSGLEPDGVTRLLSELGFDQDRVARLGMDSEFQNLGVSDLRISAKLGKVVVSL